MRIRLTARRLEIIPARVSSTHREHETSSATSLPHSLKELVPVVTEQSPDLPGVIMVIRYVLQSNLSAQLVAPAALHESSRQK